MQRLSTGAQQSSCCCHMLTLPHRSAVFRLRVSLCVRIQLGLLRDLAYISRSLSCPTNSSLVQLLEQTWKRACDFGCLFGWTGRSCQQLPLRLSLHQTGCFQIVSAELSSRGDSLLGNHELWQPSPAAYSTLAAFTPPLLSHQQPVTDPVSFAVNSKPYLGPTSFFSSSCRAGTVPLKKP